VTSDGEFAILLFMIPFVLVGLITFGVALFCIFSDCALIMTKHDVLLQRRLFGMSFSTRHATSTITGVQREVAYTQNGQRVYAVGIQIYQAKPFAFGSSLSDDEKAWLSSEIESFWREVLGFETAQQAR
ncbi:MAG TPA: hypothetical protein VEJ63_08235, partial [Planctomycetota bacterium]|nr:hypothetical protein [Planctomycetota bacterium]